MRTVNIVMSIMLLCGALNSAQPRIPSHPLVTQAQYEQWLIDLSNWGRWGPNDELGALNLITPAKRRAAAALVTDGILHLPHRPKLRSTIRARSRGR